MTVRKCKIASRTPIFTFTSIALQQPTPDEAVVKWFLDHGSDPDHKGSINSTPLSMAVRFASLTIIKMLLERCSAPQHGYLLHHAAGRRLDDCEAVLQLVVDHFLPEINRVQYADDAFWFEWYKGLGLGTPLHEAVKSGRPETVMWLLDHGADMSIVDSNGRTPLEVAGRLGNALAIECFKRYEQSANLNATTKL